ncbi:hypothetical protein ACQUJT_24955 [Ralstonia pseudosolanacearum]
MAGIITPNFKNFGESMAWHNKYKDLYRINNFVRDEIKRKCPNLLSRFDNWSIYPDPNIDDPYRRALYTEATTKGNSTQFNFGWFNKTPSDPGQYFIFMHEFRHISPANAVINSSNDVGQSVMGQPGKSRYEQDADEWAKNFIGGKCGCD